MITDISKQGARLFADGVEVPDQFHLLISGDKGARRQCQVVWRLGGEIGVTFVGPDRRLVSRLTCDNCGATARPAYPAQLRADESFTQLLANRR